MTGTASTLAAPVNPGYFLPGVHGSIRIGESPQPKIHGRIFSRLQSKKKEKRAVLLPLTVYSQYHFQLCMPGVAGERGAGNSGWRPLTAPAMATSASAGAAADEATASDVATGGEMVIMGTFRTAMVENRGAARLGTGNPGNRKVNRQE